MADGVSNVILKPEKIIICTPNFQFMPGAYIDDTPTISFYVSKCIIGKAILKISYMCLPLRISSLVDGNIVKNPCSPLGGNISIEIEYVNLLFVKIPVLSSYFQHCGSKKKY